MLATAWSGMPPCKQQGSERCRDDDRQQQGIQQVSQLEWHVLRAFNQSVPDVGIAGAAAPSFAAALSCLQGGGFKAWDVDSFGLAPEAGVTVRVFFCGGSFCSGE